MLCAPAADNVKNTSEKKELSGEALIEFLENAPQRSTHDPPPRPGCNVSTYASSIAATTTVPLRYATNGMGGAMLVVDVRLGTPPRNVAFLPDSAINMSFYFLDTDDAFGRSLGDKSDKDDSITAKLLADAAPIPPLIKQGSSCSQQIPDKTLRVAPSAHPQMPSSRQGDLGGLEGVESIEMDGFWAEHAPFHAIDQSMAMSPVSFFATGVIGLAYGGLDRHSFLREWGRSRRQLRAHTNAGNDTKAVTCDPGSRITVDPPSARITAVSDGILGSTRAELWSIDDVEKLQPLSDVFAVYLHSSIGGGGCLLLGGYDDRFYNARLDAIHWIPTRDNNDDLDPPWTLSFRALLWNGHPIGTCAAPGDCRAVIRLGEYAIQAPAADVDQLMARGMACDALCRDGGSDMGNLTIEFDDGFALSLVGNELVHRTRSANTTMCVPAIVANPAVDAPADLWWLGSALMRKYFVVFDGAQKMLGFVRPDSSYYAMNGCKSRGAVTALGSGQNSAVSEPPRFMSSRREGGLAGTLRFGTD